MQIFLHLTVTAVQLVLAGLLYLQLHARWTLGLLFTLLVTLGQVGELLLISGIMLSEVWLQRHERYGPRTGRMGAGATID